MRRHTPSLALLGLLAAAPLVAAPRPYLVKDVMPGSANSFPGGLQRLNGADGLGLFRTEDAAGSTLWRTDGTPEGTFHIADGPYRVGVVLGGRYWYLGPGGLWSSDGSAAGTALAVSLPARFYDRVLHAVGEDLYFVVGRDELWRSDGTADGTAQVAVIPDMSTSRIDLLTTHLGRLWFIKSSPDDDQLWSSDGTAAGTQLVASGLEQIEYLTSVGDLLFFYVTHFDEWETNALYRTDGTTAGTFAVKTTGAMGDYPLVSFGDPPQAWFSAAVDPTNYCQGRNLCVTDGTVAGTRTVRSPQWSCPPQPSRMVASGDRLYFEATSGCGSHALWSIEPTTLAIELAGASGPSQIWFPNDVDGTLYFRASDPLTGWEPWRSDGTQAGTYPLGDLLPGPAGSNPYGFSRLGGRLLFGATDPDHGYELWAHDLDPAVTGLLRNDSLRSLDREASGGLPLPLDASRDLYQAAFASWDEDPGMVGDSGRPLVFYGTAGNERLQLLKTATGGVLIRF